MDQPQEISRIVIESESVWLRVKENVSNSLNSSMEARLATLPGGKDGEVSKRVRGEVERRIGKISEEMFRMMNPNLRVNGHNYEDYISASEQFDEPLDRKIKALFTERLSWDLTVIGKRNKTPGLIHKLEETLAVNKEKAEWLPDDELGVKAEADAGPLARDIPPPPRQEETVETFKTTADNLRRLSTTAPAQVARAARAQTVMEDIGNMVS